MMTTRTAAPFRPFAGRRLPRAGRALAAIALGLAAWGACAQGKPPCRIGDVARAGALNYDARILEYHAGKGLYRVKYVKGYVGDEEWVPAAGLKTCEGIPPAPVVPEFFVGTWRLFTGGGGAYRKQSSGDWKLVALDAAKAPPVTIRGDGRYVWTVGGNRPIEGAWRLARPDELKSGYDKRGTTLILLKGEDGKDWLVSRWIVLSQADNADRIQMERTDLGLTYRGGRQ